MTEEEFYKELETLNITLSSLQKEQLESFYHLLITWNEQVNLTRITEKKEVYLKHFFDSLTLNKAIDLEEVESLCDIGTGAGFPGMVIKIVFPKIKVTLVDSLNKRIKFLECVKEQLHLDNLEIIHERGEIFAKSHKEQYDVVTSRAVSRLRIIAEICIPLVKTGGYFIPMKANVLEELIESKRTLQVLDSTLEQKIVFLLPKENSTRTLLKIKKEKKTNPKYPRTIDKIKKIAL